MRTPQLILILLCWCLASIASANHRIVLDNADPEGVTLTGTWATTTLDTDLFSDTALHDQNSAKGTKSVTFTPTISIAGRYKVYLWWPAAPTRTTAAPVEITHADGQTPLTVDQTTNGGQW